MLQPQQKRSLPKQSRNPSLGRIYSTKRQALSQILHYPQSMLIDDYYFQHRGHQSSSLLKREQQRQQIQQRTKQKIIKFVGDKQSNIRQIVMSMDSLVQCESRILMGKERRLIEKEIAGILEVFYQKIEKIRGEREGYKLLYEEEKIIHIKEKNQSEVDITQLNQQLLNIRKEKQCLMQKFQNQTKRKQYFQRQCMQLQQRLKLSSYQAMESFQIVNRSIETLPYQYSNNNQLQYQDSDETQQQVVISRVINSKIHHPTYQSQTESNLIDTDREENEGKDKGKEKSKEKEKVQINNKMQSKNKIQNKGKNQKAVSCQQKEQLQHILKKHNLQPNQLGDIIEEYLKEMKDNYEKEFQNQQEKKLYFLAKKMQAKVWNKKVKKDIQKLMQVKESSRE